MQTQHIEAILDELEAALARGDASAVVKYRNVELETQEMIEKLRSDTTKSEEEFAAQFPPDVVDTLRGVIAGTISVDIAADIARYQPPAPRSRAITYVGTEGAKHKYLITYSYNNGLVAKEKAIFFSEGGRWFLHRVNQL